MHYSLDKVVLISLQKLYRNFFGAYELEPLKRETDINKASELIYEILSKDEPCMLSRYGAVEIAAIVNYLSIQNKEHSILKYIKGEEVEWWWNDGIRKSMTSNAGFFPNTDEYLNNFCELCINDSKYIDILASWQLKENFLVNLFPNAKLIDYTSFDCFWADVPWTKVLYNKKVLVVHPFSEEILYQYNNNRDKLFENSLILPEFELKVLKAVQSIGGSNNYDTWFHALENMKRRIDNIDYDICLLGCGAYGMPLAAHIKRNGKKAVHIGGSLQLWFGIKGKRWEDPLYGYEVHKIKGRYPSLFNSFWIRPGIKNQVKNLDKIDNGCYW